MIQELAPLSSITQDAPFPRLPELSQVAALSFKRIASESSENESKNEPRDDINNNNNHPSASSDTNNHRERGIAYPSESNGFQAKNHPEEVSAYGGANRSISEGHSTTNGLTYYGQQPHLYSDDHHSNLQSNNGNSRDFSQDPRVPSTQESSNLTANHSVPREASMMSSKPVYCICKTSKEGIMVGCDICDNWFHPRCINLSKREAERSEYFVCPNCRPFLPEEFKLTEMRFHRERKRFCGEEIREYLEFEPKGTFEDLDQLSVLSKICAQLLNNEIDFSLTQRQEFLQIQQTLVMQQQEALKYGNGGQSYADPEASMINNQYIVPLKSPNCECRVFPLLNPTESRNVFSHFFNNVPWTQETVQGSRTPEPYLSAWYAEKAATTPLLGTERKTLRFSPALIELKSLIESITHVPFDFVCLIQFTNGFNYIPEWDESKGSTGEQPITAILTLGAGRWLQLKHRVTEEDCHQVPLENGSIAFLYQDTARAYLSSILKETREENGTILAIFRRQGEFEAKGKKIRYGESEEIPRGTVFLKRTDLGENGLHTKQSGALCGSAHKGMESIVFSHMSPNGYDGGNEIIFSVNGRHFANEDPQTVQDMKRTIQALVKNFDDRIPIRIIRSSKLDSRFAPLNGFRYDGVYYVVGIWAEIEEGIEVDRIKLQNDGHLPPNREVPPVVNN